MVSVFFFGFYCDLQFYLCLFVILHTVRCTRPLPVVDFLIATLTTV